MKSATTRDETFRPIANFDNESFTSCQEFVDEELENLKTC